MESSSRDLVDLVGNRKPERIYSADCLVERNRLKTSRARSQVNHLAQIQALLAEVKRDED